MSENQVKKLTQIYNTLLMVSTRGEDTILMGECLKAIQQLAEEGAKEAGLTLSRGPIPAGDGEGEAAPEDVNTEE